MSSPELELMINQLWQGKQVSPDSPSYLLSSPACLPQPGQAGGGFLGCPCVPAMPLRAGMGPGTEAVKEPCHSPPALLSQGSGAAAHLPPASSRPGGFFSKKEKMSFVSSGGGSGCDRPGLSSLCDSGPRNHMLGQKNKRSSVFSFVYLLDFEVSWS